jgi:membrane-bound serine protease (ClpP class)
VLVLLALVLAIVFLPLGWGVVAVAGAAVIDLTETVLLLRWSRRRRAAVGVEALVGRTAVAVGPLSPAGRVKLDGELWEARAARDVAPGEEVTVKGVDGLVLEVDAG